MFKIYRHKLSTRFVTSNFTPGFIITFAAILCIPALYSGFFIDDLRIVSLLKGYPAEVNDISFFGLFSFVLEDEAQFQEMVQIGHVPWWTSQDLQLRLWRPLSELSHWLDYHLWGASAYHMHLINIVWYTLVLSITWGLYSALIPNRSIALIALMIYAWDSTHAMTVTWISNRNALIALLFGVAALLLHHKFRTHQNKFIYMILAIMALVCGLLSSELAISTTGYLFAYTTFLDRTKSLKRFWSLTPYALVTLCWIVFYKCNGFGAANGPYADPFDEPLRFVTMLFSHIPVLLAGQFGLIPAELYVDVDTSISTLMLLFGILGVGVLA